MTRPVTGDARMLPRLIERFEDWRQAPVAYQAGDPRVMLRRLDEHEFAAAYDLVDAAFGRPRPRAAYEWLYRHNPRGVARCVAAFEIATGRMVSLSAEWPWPAAHHAIALPGSLSGDRATVPDWQRQGLYGNFNRYRLEHPWRGLRIAWPNHLSRHAITRMGRSAEMIGPLKRGVVLLDAQRTLSRRGVPAALAAPLTRAAGAAQAAWQHVRLSGGRGLRVERLDRFDERHDALTAAAMQDWSGYWCPHDAEFLNWRYCDHPSDDYAVMAADAGDRLVGYTVVGAVQRTAVLMELVAHPDITAAAPALLAAALAHARAAGAQQLEAFAPRAWRHWPLLHRIGAFERPSTRYMQFVEPQQLDRRDMDRWRLSPGDFDAL